MPKEDILQMRVAHKQQLASNGVNKIGLSSSYIRNEATGNSDIDLLVDIQRDKKTFKNFLALNYYLEDLLAEKLNW
jgi:uncharacterized protein